MTVLFYFLTILSLSSSFEITVTAPNIEYTQYGSNLFIGRTPHEQLGDFQTKEIFLITIDRNSTEETQTYYNYHQLEKVLDYRSCISQSISQEVLWAVSVDSLQSQAYSTNYGYEQESTIGLELDMGLSVETSIRNALLFGNSETTKNQVTKSDYDYSYTFRVSDNDPLYISQVNWNDFKNEWYDPDYLSDMSALTESPTVGDILEIWRKYGTHGINKFTMGAHCFGSSYMKSGGTQTNYYDYKSSTSSSDAGLFWFKHSSDQSQSDTEEQTYDEKVTYKYSDRYCYGSIKNSACSERTGAEDSPTFIRWTYKPMWKFTFDAGTVNQNALAKMNQIFQDISYQGYECRVNSCNDNGQCAPKLEVWNNDLGDITNIDDLEFWDSGVCFCETTYIGEQCQYNKLVPVSVAYEQTESQNSFDGDLDYTVDNPNVITGIGSKHDDGYEDRRFGFQFRHFENSTFGKRIEDIQIFGTTRYDQNWDFNCDRNRILTKLYSYHSNTYEDRRWEFGCVRLEYLQIAYRDNTPLCIDIGPNNYDEYFEHICTEGYVLHGLKSDHDNGYDDRRFTLHCCQLEFLNDDYVDTVTSTWEDWDNNYDQDQHWESATSFMKGIHSIHDDDTEDRKYKFIRTKPSVGSISSSSSWSSETSLDSTWSYNCNDDSGIKNSFINGFSSTHDDGKEDRRFKFRCATWEGLKEYKCFSTPYLNEYDEEFTFLCPDGYALAGISSIHDDGPDDRIFKFNCCTMWVSKNYQQTSKVFPNVVSASKNQACDV